MTQMAFPASNRWLNKNFLKLTGKKTEIFTAQKMKSIFLTDGLIINWTKLI